MLESAEMHGRPAWDVRMPSSVVNSLPGGIPEPNPCVAGTCGTAADWAAFAA
jgi:hypothetical protein